MKTKERPRRERPTVPAKELQDRIRVSEFGPGFRCECGCQSEPYRGPDGDPETWKRIEHRRRLTQLENEYRRTGDLSTWTAEVALELLQIERERLEAEAG